MATFPVCSMPYLFLHALEFLLLWRNVTKRWPTKRLGSGLANVYCEGRKYQYHVFRKNVHKVVRGIIYTVVKINISVLKRYGY